MQYARYSHYEVHDLFRIKYINMLTKYNLLHLDPQMWVVHFSIVIFGFGFSVDSFAVYIWNFKFTYALCDAITREFDNEHLLRFRYTCRWWIFFRRNCSKTQQFNTHTKRIKLTHSRTHADKESKMRKELNGVLCYFLCYKCYWNIYVKSNSHTMHGKKIVVCVLIASFTCSTHRVCMCIVYCAV